MPICNIRKFDYFNHVDNFLEHSQVIVGSDLISLVVAELSNKTYTGYQNDKTCTLKLIFPNYSDLEDFLEFIITVDLKKAYAEKKFYQVLKEAAIRAAGLGSECCHTTTKLEYEDNPELFVPKLNEEEQSITIKIPNNHVLYIPLIPNITIYDSLNGNQLITMGHNITGTLLLKHQSFIFFPNLQEKEEIIGTRIGSLILKDGALYLLGDIGFSLCQTIEEIVEGLYDTNYIAHVEQMVELRSKEWQQYRQNAISRNSQAIKSW